MDKLKAVLDYLKFLSEDYDNIASFAIAHGYRWTNDTIEKGRELRHKMKDAGVNFKNE